MERDANFRTKVEFCELNKLIKKKICENRYQKYLTIMKQAAATGKLKRARSSLVENKKRIIELRKSDGSLTTETRRIDHIVQEFYTKLYGGEADCTFVTRKSDEPFLQIIDSEIRNAIQSMKNGKAPGIDGLTGEMLKLGKELLVTPLKSLFNNIIKYQQIPEDFAFSKTILLPKKGNPDDIRNCRPIPLLPTVTKYFSEVLCKRLQQQIEQKQDVEQAGFRPGKSTIDQIHVLTMLIEKTREYNLPLYLLFVDYEKAFDSVEHASLWRSLESASVHPSIISTLQEIQSKSTTTTFVHERQIPIQTRRGVRQGDCISPLLFNAALQLVFDELDWQNKGVNVDGKKLSHLRFADDIVLISHSFNQIKKMLKELEVRSAIVGLRLNASKTKLMSNRELKSAIVVRGEKVESVNEFIYLGRCVKMSEGTEADIRGNTKQGWKVFF
uniref:LINE-1 reverse transcriptase n=1 Tax=Ascaris suum TaxID=6253 RepID=F1KYC2_ASCSU